ncbi:STY0301 family protein [Serratia fonticola]
MRKKINYYICVTLLIVPCGALASMTVCPTQSLNALVSIRIFDGNPHDNADLVPEPANQNNGQWKNLERIYRQKRNISVRCQYKNGLAFDVTVLQNVTECRSSTKIGVLTLICY